MLKSMVVILAILGSVSAQANTDIGNNYAVQDQKAVGAVPVHSSGGYAVQDQKAVSLDSQVETAQLLDLNEGF